MSTEAWKAGYEQRSLDRLARLEREIGALRDKYIKAADLVQGDLGPEDPDAARLRAHANLFGNLLRP